MVLVLVSLHNQPQYTMSFEPTIYVNVPANKGRQIAAGTPIICFERFRLPFRNKNQRSEIKEFIRLYKVAGACIEGALLVGKGEEVGVSPYILKWVA